MEEIQGSLYLYQQEKKVRDQQSESLREVPKGKENQAGTKDLTSSSKFSACCVLTLQFYNENRVLKKGLRKDN